MKNIVLTLFCVLVLQSCETNNEHDHPGNASQIAFSIKDSQGNDLLDPASPNYYSKDSIKIYDTNGTLVNYIIESSKDERDIINAFVYGVHHFCNEEELANLYGKRYWHWNSTEIDTVEIFLKNVNDYRIDSYKFKINEVEYDLENMPTRVIQLVK